MECKICEKKCKSYITCPYCNYTTCQSCTEHYLLDTVHEYHCMSCRKEWQLDWVNQSCSPSFISNYRKRIEQLLLQKEKNLLPQTQHIVHHVVSIEVIEDQIKQYLKDISVLQDNINTLRRKRVEHQKQMCTTFNKIYLFACPKQDCKGFISNSYECDLCFQKICKSCKEISNDLSDHKCDLESVKSISLVESECKSCPNCSTMIYKSNGCNHMWCTQCHIHFHWDTLLIEKKILHNPHYYEYITANPSDTSPLQNNCLHSFNNQPIRLYRIDSKTLLLQLESLGDSLSIEYKKKIEEIITFMIHMKERVYPDIPVENDNSNQDLGIKFLQNKINEDEFTSLLYKRYKHNKGYSSYQYILDTYFMITREWLSSLTTFAPSFVLQYNHLCEILNKSIFQLQKQYGFSFTLLQ